ncbi:MAG: proline--tRNA ligase [Thermodesulfovibrionales bacterium]|nr:proline--tRNA ligase [Thermodesulfovibrionales bacterium]
MRFTNMFIPTLRETPSDAEAVSHKLMLRAGYVRQLAAGLYMYLPLGWRVMAKINAILKEEMDAIGAQEISLPVLHPAELWQQTGRWDEIKEEMFRLKDRGGRDMCLGMTHEEVMTYLASREIRSYRQLPQSWYQIQTKLRDEARPKSGILRTREFIMKDSYSFDADEAGLDKSYELHAKAYHRIFQRCGLEFYQVQSDPGMMGGKGAHEFMAPSPAGEDEAVLCVSCGYAANVELAGSISPGERFKAEPHDIHAAKTGDGCPKCGAALKIERCIEIGNIFKLGTKYSLPMKAFYLTEDGSERPLIMGSYGIGPARIAAAAIEQSHDGDGMIWPASIAPFDAEIIPLNIKDENTAKTAEALYNALNEAGIETLMDDRDERAGVKFKDADLIGIPKQVIIGERNLKEGLVEVKDRRTKEALKVKPDEVLKAFKS